MEYKICKSHSMFTGSYLKTIFVYKMKLPEFRTYKLLLKGYLKM